MSAGSLPLEDRVALVRSPAVQALFAEAVTCYRSGANRSAVVAVWTSVCADVLDKAEHLAGDGTAKAAEVITRLEAIRKADRVTGLKDSLSLESDLLGIAAELDLITDTDKVLLERIRSDRNLCAHPSMLGAGETWDPPGEVVRAHLVVALDTLLVHPPLQGKAVMNRLVDYISNPSFGSGDEGFIREVFGVRVRPTTQRSILDVTLKHAVREDSPPNSSTLDPVNFADRCGVVFSALATGPLSREASEAMGKLATAVPVADESARRMVGRLGALEEFWAPLDQPTRERLGRLVLDPDAAPQVLRVAASVAARDAVPSLNEAVGTLPALTAVAAFGNSSSPFLSQFVAHWLNVAYSYRAAEAVLEQLVLPIAPLLTRHELSAVLTAWALNRQVREASDSPRMAALLLDATAHLWPGSCDAWETFLGAIDQPDPDVAEQSWFVYADLRTRLAELWP